MKGGSNMDEKNKNDTITIKKDDLWKYSTFVLLAIVIIGAIVMFSGGNGGSGNTVIQQGGPTGVTAYKAYAKEINLDSSAFNNCLDNGETASKVSGDMILGQSQGVQGTPGFLVNGQLVSGAQPYSVFAQVIDAELASPSANNIQITAQDYVKGDSNAPVTIIEYSDFECPFCARFYTDSFGQIEKNYIDTGKVKFVYRHFPLSFHPNAQKAAEAVECAGKVGGAEKFWEMHDLLFEKGV